MSIASGFTKMKNYILTSSGYKLLSRWTSSQTVHMGDGTDDTDTVEYRFGAMKGVTSSLATDNDEFALSASAGKNLQDQCTQLNQSLTNKLDASNVDPMFCESIPGRNHITNFLHVDLSNRNSYINKIHYFGSNNPATTFVNSPYTAGPFFGYRVVRWCSESANTYHLVTVEVHEQYPVSGRVWSNTYDISIGTWYGWKCNQGNTFIDVGTILKSSTTIAAGATVTYVATRDCFVNVSAYAHGSGQNTKIYINNVCIFSPYTNNGSDAGLVIVEKTVPLKTGQTIKIENGTYTTSAYAIFAAF